MVLLRLGRQSESSHLSANPVLLKRSVGKYVGTHKFRCLFAVCSSIKSPFSLPGVDDDKRLSFFRI